MIGELLNWLRWCIELREILPKEVGLVSHRELTKEEYEYPLIRLEGMGNDS